jgi:hypothetical protein
MRREPIHGIDPGQPRRHIGACHETVSLFTAPADDAARTVATHRSTSCRDVSDDRASSAANSTGAAAAPVSLAACPTPPMSVAISLVHCAACYTLLAISRNILAFASSVADSSTTAVTRPKASQALVTLTARINITMANPAPILPPIRKLARTEPRPLPMTMGDALADGETVRPP